MPAMRKNTPTSDSTLTETELVQRLFQIAELLMDAEIPTDEEPINASSAENTRPDHNARKHNRRD